MRTITEDASVIGMSLMSEEVQFPLTVLMMTVRGPVNVVFKDEVELRITHALMQLQARYE